MTEPILTVDQMRAAERATMEAGVSEWELMQRAGKGAAQWVARIAGGRDVTVLCGPGNNGGDGYVIAEFLRRRGIAVSVIAPTAPRTDTARKARSVFRGEIAETCEGFCATVVDCLFGYGLSRKLEGEFAELLEKLATSDCFKVAVDVPSSVSSDSGMFLGPQVNYDLTLALGACKIAHFLMPSMAAMGALRLVPIGLAESEGVGAISHPPRFDAPAQDSHKYKRGLLGVVAGSMPGAPILAAGAAMRAGAGYIKLFSQHTYPDAPAGLVVDHGELPNAMSDDRISAFLIGPGLGRNGQARDRIAAVLATGRPCVLDADALHLLDGEMLQHAKGSVLVVTPHEGELAALCRTFGVTADGKLNRAHALHEATGLVVLAKGPDTILASDATTRFFSRGSSWLSTAGSGDVLAGIVASRLAHHADPVRACEEAVWLHHEAARISGTAFTADELAQNVGAAMGSFL